MIHPLLDSRPIIVAIAGPNGAGKSTFHAAHLRQSGLRFLNADELGRELDLDADKAAELANALREELVKRRESFIFETVFSEPVGDKVEFLQRAATAGYAVALIFIGLSSASTSDQRVGMRVTQGGHDVPKEKVVARFARSLANLRRATARLPLVIVYDNDDLTHPFRHLATYENGRRTFWAKRRPEWLRR